MKIALAAAILFGTAIAVADGKPAADESVMVAVVGTIRTGVVAIGSETTGNSVRDRRSNPPRLRLGRVSLRRSFSAQNSAARPFVREPSISVRRGGPSRFQVSFQ